MLYIGRFNSINRYLIKSMCARYLPDLRYKSSGSVMYVYIMLLYVCCGAQENYMNEFARGNRPFARRIDN